MSGVRGCPALKGGTALKTPPLPEFLCRTLSLFTLGGLLGPLEGLLEPFGASGGHFGPSWGRLENLLEPSGAFGTQLGPSWAILGRPGGL